MSYQNNYYNCDICGKLKKKEESVRNECYIENGDFSGHYFQVCDPCIKEIGETINRLKPKND